MLELTRLIRRPVFGEASAIVRNLVYLRLLVLASVSLLTLMASVYYEAPASIAGAVAIFISVAGWSVLVLTREQLTRAPRASMREILLDFAWVFILVMLSGRSANPFIYYYLVLVAICASIFSARAAWLFCIGGILAYSSLVLLDMGAHFEHMAERYRVHLAGMGLNYVGSSLVTCYFVSRLARLIREQQTQLTRAREENLKNEQLIGIGTVAASTVHSLATPLSTLTVLAEDMATSDSADHQLREDLAIMLTQIGRCKQIMQDLAHLAEGWSQEGVISIDELKSQLEEYYALNNPGNIPRFLADEGVTTKQIASNLLLQHALINLINNALESEGAPANVKFFRRDQTLHILIQNETFLRAEKVFERWGKPGVSEKQNGLGIGSFLANSTIEKLGGRVELHAEEGAGGFRQTKIAVTVSLPLEKS